MVPTGDAGQDMISNSTVHLRPEEFRVNGPMCVRTPRVCQAAQVSFGMAHSEWACQLKTLHATTKSRLISATSVRFWLNGQGTQRHRKEDSSRQLKFGKTLGVPLTWARRKIFSSGRRRLKRSRLA